MVRGCTTKHRTGRGEGQFLQETVRRGRFVDISKPRKEAEFQHHIDGLRVFRDGQIHGLCDVQEDFVVGGMDEVGKGEENAAVDTEWVQGTQSVSIHEIFISKRKRKKRKLKKFHKNDYDEMIIQIKEGQN